MESIYAPQRPTQTQAEALAASARLLASLDDLGTAAAREQLTSAIELLSGGENTVIFDDLHIPSVMVRVPLLRLCDTLDDCEDTAPHPAFRMGTGRIAAIWVSKYLNCVVKGRAASLPYSQPRHRILYDEAVSFCRNKGEGWQLMPFSLRMALALSCRKRGFLPHGNNHGGHDYFHPEESAADAANEVTLTGTGPLTWSHNAAPSGIWDLNGTLNEWDAGFRLLDGEIQWMDTPALFVPDADLSAASPAWRALDAGGRLVAQGSRDTLRYDVTGGGICLSLQGQSGGVGNCAFDKMRAQAGFSVPDAVRLLGLYPPKNRAGLGHGWRWVRAQGEAMPMCGGAHRAEDHAGIFFVGASKRRDEYSPYSGFRSVYLDPNDIVR
jgi:hypothetical protein